MYINNPTQLPNVSIEADLGREIVCAIKRHFNTWSAREEIAKSFLLQLPTSEREWLQKWIFNNHKFKENTHDYYIVVLIIFYEASTRGKRLKKIKIRDCVEIFFNQLQTRKTIIGIIIPE